MILVAATINNRPVATTVIPAFFYPYIYTDYTCSSASSPTEPTIYGADIYLDTVHNTIYLRCYNNAYGKALVFGAK